MVIPVPVLAGNALTEQRGLFLTRTAGRFAGDDLEHVITPVAERVTMERIADPVLLLVRSAVDIPSVLYFVASLVLLAPKYVHGLARTKDLALCPVRLPAIDYHATSAVLKNFPAVTSVQDYAARLAPKGTATNVP